MDPLTSAIAVRAIVAVLLIAGGGFCIMQGSRLIMHNLHGASSPTHFKFKVGGQELGFSTGVAGTAVSLTSAAWIVCAVLVVPSVENPDGWTVGYSESSDGPQRLAGRLDAFESRKSAPSREKVLVFFNRQTALTDQQKSELLETLLRLGRYDEDTIKVVLEAKGIEVDSSEIAEQLNGDRLEAVLEFLRSGPVQELLTHEVTIEDVNLEGAGYSARDLRGDRDAFATLRVSEVKDGKSGA